MRLRIVAIGTRMPAWVEAGCGEYGKRLPRELRLEWVELPAGQRRRAGGGERAVQQETEAMMARIAPADWVVALDPGGRSWSTPQLAGQLERWQMAGRDVDLLIGGPDGLGKACRARADQCWSLSSLTLPHPLVRVLLAEQLYRAWSINQGHPYHR